LYWDAFLCCHVDFAVVVDDLEKLFECLFEFLSVSKNGVDQMDECTVSKILTAIVFVCTSDRYCDPNSPYIEYPAMGFSHICTEESLVPGKLYACKVFVIDDLHPFDAHPVP
jgi:hypothetical protein